MLLTALSLGLFGLAVGFWVSGATGAKRQRNRELAAFLFVMAVAVFVKAHL